MHRKGSLKGMIDNPTTMQERMTSRRMELDMSQAEVAAKIRFYNRRQAEWKVLSRSAYCMYETGDVLPDIEKIVTLAEALQCSPEWLAFGTQKADILAEALQTAPQWLADGIEDLVTLQEVEFAGPRKGFTAARAWPMFADWLQTQFDVPTESLALIRIDDFAENLQPGEMAFVQREATPTPTGATFVYALDGEVRVDHLTRPSANGPYRIFDQDRRGHRDVPAKSITLLGKVVGKIGV
ncbi:putative HTH domain DNA-binding protein [Brevundimonas phage vB_BpoS-Marchewka]|uniref:HTH domain DNA-binding protein n=1 Tax=Brevundimonas phage vB_BpoS-Marchewka TaxID=2948604 RepID=A0A9E7SRC3_9CAUD|nr:putative HTH domain DNA-binding protein [Brevundimonas phage vB_BpoS-Marchewka]UTC29469.1 putative HTH domain DNA-binding protein [Brevundimonas phage vB_BpoS-Bambus]